MKKKEVVSINVETSSAVKYLNDTLGHTLTFCVNYHFPESQIFFILLNCTLSGTVSNNMVNYSYLPPLTVLVLCSKRQDYSYQARMHLHIYTSLSLYL